MLTCLGVWTIVYREPLIHALLLRLERFFRRTKGFLESMEQRTDLQVEISDVSDVLLMPIERFLSKRLHRVSLDSQISK